MIEIRDPTHPLFAITPSPGVDLAMIHGAAPWRDRHPVAERVVAAAARPRTWRGLAIAALLAVVAWPLAPAAPVALLALGAAHGVGALSVEAWRVVARERAGMPFSRSLVPEVAPDDVTAPELRAAYIQVLIAHEELRRHLATAAAMQDYLRGAFERCGAVVQVSGRLARLGNALYRYDATHDSGRIRQDELGALQRAAAVADPQASRIYREAAAARRRQLETGEHLHDLRDRIGARLDLVRATLESVLALSIKLETVDREQAMLAGESVSSQLARVGDEVAILESTMEEGLEP